MKIITLSGFYGFFAYNVYWIKEAVISSQFTHIFIMNNCSVSSPAFSALINDHLAYFCPYVDIVNYLNYFPYTEKFAGMRVHFFDALVRWDTGFGTSIVIVWL